jgi:hypothetical protein
MLSRSLVGRQPADLRQVGDDHGASKPNTPNKGPPDGHAYAIWAVRVLIV